MLIINAAGVAIKIRYICPTDANGLPHPGGKQTNTSTSRAAETINAAAIFPKTIRVFLKSKQLFTNIF
jgi:hypothetical protein